VALEKLLHYDLAAKYWHMGTLSQTDVVKDGFYDTGAHKPGDDFKPIKLLLDRKVRSLICLSVCHHLCNLQLYKIKA